jgi:hypothetical protein
MIDELLRLSAYAASGGCAAMVAWSNDFKDSAKRDAILLLALFACMACLIDLMITGA